MATLKQRLHRKNSSGSYDTIHLETSSSLVLRPSGRTVEQDLEAYLPKVQMASCNATIGMRHQRVRFFIKPYIPFRCAFDLADSIILAGLCISLPAFAPHIIDLTIWLSVIWKYRSQTLLIGRPGDV